MLAVQQNDRRLSFGVWLSIALALLLLINLPIWSTAEDAPGWILFYLSFAVLLCGAEFRNSLPLCISGSIVVAAHQAVALINRYVHTVIGADMDAPLFHANAVLFAARDIYSDPRLTTLFYTRALGFAYSIFGPSHLFGEELSVFCVALSCIVFVRTLALLGVTRNRSLLLMLYGLLPAALIFTSVTLRESYQAFFMQLYVLAVLRLRQKPSVGRGLLIVASVIGLALLHNGLAAFGVALLAAGLLWGSGQGRRLITWKRVVGVLFAAVLVMTFFILKPYASPAAQALREGRVLEYAKAYREGTAVDGRANYGVMLDLSSPIAFLRTFAMLEVLFFVAPLPWQVQNAADVYALCDAWLRVSLMIAAVVAWRHARGSARDTHRFLLMVYMALETLWSLGTTNWGTGIRHHVVAYGVLVVIGGPQLLQWLGRMTSALFGPGTARPIEREAGHAR
jgi:hypothetical protein